MKQSLYSKVFEDLYSKIISGYYSVGDKLQTEIEIQDIYKVSRTPVRQALLGLQEKGMIERNPGIGTEVVNNKASQSNWPLIGGFSYTFNKKWKHLQVKTINVSTVLPEEDVRKSLKLKKGNPAIEITRLRMEKDKPVFLLINYYKDIDVRKVKYAGEILNMRQFAKETLGIEFAYVTEELTAVPADEKKGYYLQVEKGFPLLQIKRVSYDLNYEPVEYVIYYVLSNNWPYNITYNHI